MNTLHISNVKYPKMKVCITLSKPYRNVKLEVNGRTVENKYFLTYKKARDYADGLYNKYSKELVYLRYRKL